LEDSPKARQLNPNQVYEVSMLHAQRSLLLANGQYIWGSISY